MIQFGDESAADVILSNFENMPLSQAKLEALQPVIDFLGKIKSLETFKRGVDAIQQFQTAIPEAYRGQIAPFISGLLRNLQKGKTAAGQNDQAAYIESKLGKGDKKGF
jgi:aminopeptidase N